MPPCVTRPASRTAFAAAIAAVLIAAPVTTASAQGLFDFLVGGLRRPPPPPPTIGLPNDLQRQYGPRTGGYRAPGRESVAGSDVSGAPRVAYCVRLCDGRYFPISSGRTAGETCSSLCPAAPTRLYYGHQIDNAYDRQGRSYRQLENAFAYRKKVVAGCSCNGRTGFGIARVPIGQDPTLKSGDIVARASGLAVYRGSNAQREPVFSSIDSANLSRRLQEELADVEVGPRPTAAGIADSASAVEEPPGAPGETASSYAEENKPGGEGTPRERVRSTHDAFDVIAPTR